jgi:hypothetical protein
MQNFANTFQQRSKSLINSQISTHMPLAHNVHFGNQQQPTSTMKKELLEISERQAAYRIPEPHRVHPARNPSHG